MSRKLNLTSLFRPASLWGTLKASDPIPANLTDTRNKQATGCFSSGIGNAVYKLLRGEVRYHYAQGADPKVSVYYPSSEGGKRATGQINAMTSGGQSPAVLFLVGMACGLYVAVPTKARWLALLKHVRSHFGEQVLTEADLTLLEQTPEFKDLMLALSDAAYHDIKESNFLEAAPGSQPTSYANFHPFTSPAQDLDPASAPLWQGLDTTLRGRLSRLMRRGGRALLTGDTGTFKTETVKRCAVDAGLTLVVVKGRQGMEDRELFGGVYPSPQGVRFVYGPLAQAFQKAREGRVCLLIDELLRFEPLYLNALVGAMDELSPQEVVAMGHSPVGEGRQYALALPNGEVIVAPKAHLVIAATTNQGDDFVQANQLDTALLGRFEMVLEVERPDPQTLASIYKQIGGAELGQRALRLDDWTQTQHEGHGGLLRRPSNPRIIIQMLTEATSLVAEGAGLEEAFVEAVEVAVVPFCANRDSKGKLDEGAALLLNEARKIAA